MPVKLLLLRNSVIVIITITIFTMIIIIMIIDTIVISILMIIVIIMLTLGPDMKALSRSWGIRSSAGALCFPRDPSVSTLAEGSHKCP